jgi:DNA-binding CsgD family transcriptional regulator
MLKAGCIVGELPHELGKGKVRIRRLGPRWIVSVSRGIVSTYLTDRTLSSTFTPMSKTEAIKGIRNAARRRERADVSRREARADLKHYCREALAAGVPISQIAREAKISRQSVYALLGQSPFQ